MCYGSVSIDGKWYYFDLFDGAMYIEKWAEGYYYGSDGVRTEKQNTEELYLIEGTSSVTVEQMVRFYKNRISIEEYPAEVFSGGGAPDIETLALIFYEEAEKEQIRAEVAWAQTMLETNFLRYGGQVKVEQFNFAGLGAVDGGASGADFSGYGSNAARIGVRAQIQHLKAYACENADKEIAPSELVDPRFKYVSPKGCAKYVQYLGQQENPSGKGWATSKDYGYKILALILEMKKN